MVVKRKIYIHICLVDLDFCWICSGQHLTACHEPAPRSSSSSDQSTEFQKQSLPCKCSCHTCLTLMCHSLSKGVLLGWPPWWRVLTSVFLETSTPEEAWLVTIILAFAQGFLLTSLTLFLSRVQPCPGLFSQRISLLLLDSDATCSGSRHSETLANGSITFPCLWHGE